MMPNFLLIGAMRSGTTSHYRLLRQHRDIFMPDLKEPGFFRKEVSSANSLGWYESLFAGAKEIAIGEASTSYTKRHEFPGTASRIAELIPHAKLIYVVRNPLERIASHWIVGASRGYCSPSWEEACVEPQVVDPSCYWRQISAYRDHFPDDQIHVVFFEDFKADPLKSMNGCFAFLGVGSVSLAGPFHENAALTDRPVAGFLKALGFMPSLVPTRLRNRLRKAAKKPIPRPIWQPDLLSQVRKELYEDSQTFLRFYGKPANYWDI